MNLTNFDISSFNYASTTTLPDCVNWCSSIHLDSLFNERWCIIFAFISLMVYYALPFLKKMTEKEFPEWLPDLCIQVSFWGMALYLILIALKLRGITSW